MTSAATRRERAIAITAVALAVGFLVWLHAAVAVEWRRSRSLEASGVVANGVVIERESAAGPRTDGYRVTYRYVARAQDGRESTHTATREVDRATFDSLSIGSAVEVRYDLDDPTRSDLARNDRLAMMLFIVGLIDLGLVVAAFRVVRGARAEARSAGSTGAASAESGAG